MPSIVKYPKLKEITDEEAKEHESLGQAFGMNLGHCLFQGLNHCDNFVNRVRYYVVKKRATSKNKSINNGEIISVEFFE